MVQVVKYFLDYVEADFDPEEFDALSELVETKAQRVVGIEVPESRKYILEPLVELSCNLPKDVVQVFLGLDLALVF